MTDMPVKLTILCENTATVPQVSGAHGLAVLVETPDRRVLLDTGPDATAASNAAALGVSLPPLDAIVLSHGHYDHVGGLEAVLAECGPTTVIAHPGLAERAHARDPGGEVRYIGPPAEWDHYERLGARMRWQEGPAALGGYLMTSGEITCRADEASTPPQGRFLRETPGGMAPDEFRDELALIVLLEGCSLVLTGCAHVGAVNTVRHAGQVANGRPPRALVGGLHLLATPEAQVRQVAAQLHALGVRTLAPCHCTGARAVRTLRDAFEGRTLTVGAGNVITVTLTGDLEVTTP